MYNNKNKKFKQLPLYLFCILNFFNISETKKPLDELLTFSVNGDIFSALQKTCKDKNINLGILTNRNINFVGNFHEISIKHLFKIIFDEKIQVDTVGSFILIKDGKPYTKIYEIRTSLNKEQIKNVNIFLENFIKNYKDCFFIYNGEDGTIIYHGFKETHNIIENYINKLNQYYGEQIILECKIIAISNSKSNHQIDFMDIVNNLLCIFRDYEENKNIPIAILNIMSQCSDKKDEIEFLTKYLSIHYKISNIQEIQILLRNKQVTSFHNGETRYADKVYDHRIIPIENMYINSNNVEKNKYTNTVLKNVKELKAGMNLKIEATIINPGVLLNIDYNQSSFRSKMKNQLPEIMENSFATSIHMNYNKVIVLNGLKTTIHSKRIKNKSNFFLWRWLFERKEGEETECQILFLIRVKKV